MIAKNALDLESREWMSMSAMKKNWDIKRDFTRKHRQLSRKTEKAMAGLIRQQILERRGQDALIGGGNISKSIAQQVQEAGFDGEEQKDEFGGGGRKRRSQMEAMPGSPDEEDDRRLADDDDE